MVSILILSYNALEYTKNALIDLKNTEDIEYEIIVLDNNSDDETKKMLQKMKADNYIDKLILADTNNLFAKGNNLASLHCSENSKYILLLNNDIKINNSKWLKILLDNHKRGATSFGICENNPWTRCDGFCFLIDKDLYSKYKLDEQYEWWWSVTKLQSELLKNNYTITGIKDHNHLLYHFGGASGDAWITAKGMDTDSSTVLNWFEGKKINVISSL